MQDFEKGLKLVIFDRDQFEQFINNNAHDPGVHYDSWGDNSVPQTIYVDIYYEDGKDPYYKCINEYVNGVFNTHYYDEPLLNQLLNENIIEKDGHNLELVEEYDSNLPNSL